MSRWKRIAALGCGAALILFQMLNTAGAPAWVVSPWDKAVHGVYFGALAALLWVAMGGRRPYRVLGLVLLVGIADEWHQAYLPARTASVGDLLADVLSAAVVLALLTVWRIRRDGRGAACRVERPGGLSTTTPGDAR